MFQINRKEYLNMIDALGGLQAVLETERETQQSMADSSEANFIGVAGAVFRSCMKIFLSVRGYEKAYEQSKKMKESMESLLPLVNKLLGEADTLDKYLETGTAAYAVTSVAVPYGQAGNEIFMLNKGYVHYLEQQCEDLVEKGKLLKGQMQDAINKCSGIIDCSAEQTAINEAYKSVLRIENFKQAFQRYVLGVRDLDESLRLDFQAYTDAEVVETGKALQEVVHNGIESISRLNQIGEILEKAPKEWTLLEVAFLQKNSDIVEEKVDLDALMKDRVYCSNVYLNEEQMAVNAQYIYYYFFSIGWSENAICAMLGNMEKESTFNPGKWQKKDNLNLGFGLAQWSPAKDYFNWAEQKKLDPYDIDTQLLRIHLEADGEIEHWQEWRHELNISFEEFTQSDMSYNELTKVYMLCYERPKEKSKDAQEERSKLAKKWYDKLNSIYNMEGISYD